MQELKIAVATGRRVLLARQGLLAAAAAKPWRTELTGPKGTLLAVQRLGAVQLDPVSVVERSHQLTLYARVKNYKPAWFDALFARGELFEYLANARCALPMNELPDFWPIMLQARSNAAERLAAHPESVAEVLAAARRGQVRPREVGNDGPRLMGMGYNAPDEGSKLTGSIIDLLWLGGQLFVNHRQGAEKGYGLPEKVVPRAVWQMVKAVAPEAVAPAADASVRPWAAPAVRKGHAPWTDMLMRRYLDAYGLADTTDFRFGWQKLTAAERKAWLEEAAERGEVVPVRLGELKRRYWARTDAAEQLAAAEAAPAAWEPEPEIRFLPPLDNLLWHRPRLIDLFGFDYVWEVYIPAAKRKYGAYTLPILEGEQLIGRIDPRLDRAGRRLILQLVQLEPGIKPDRTRLRRLAKAVQRFAVFHGATQVEVLRTEPDGLKLPL